MVGLALMGMVVRNQRRGKGVRKVRDGRLGLEWEGLRTKERSIDKHIADVKIGHALLCENT